jgi:hypothetical protein
MLADHRDRHPDAVDLVHLDGAADDAGATLEARLGLDAPLPSPLPGDGNRYAAAFPAGHWRRYAEAFAPEFAALQPVAVRLGYPAD